MVPNYSIYKTYDCQLQHNPSLRLIAAETEGNNEFECKIYIQLTVLDADGQPVFCNIDMLDELDRTMVLSDMMRMLYVQMQLDGQLAVQESLNSEDV